MNPIDKQTNQNQNQNQDILGSLSPSEAKDMLTGFIKTMLEANKEEMKKEIVDTVNEQIPVCMDKARKEQLEKMGWSARWINNHPTGAARAMAATTVFGTGAIGITGYRAVKEWRASRRGSSAGDGLVAAITGGGFSFIGG